MTVEEETHEAFEAVTSKDETEVDVGVGRGEGWLLLKRQGSFLSAGGTCCWTLGLVAVRKVEGLK